MAMGVPVKLIDRETETIQWIFMYDRMEVYCFDLIGIMVFQRLH